ncbi:MAG TPA: HDOD domain-containing protein [bacterium]|nr:HDOD domain-containing protein [bacterium]
MLGGMHTEKQFGEQEMKKFMARVKDLPTLPVIVTKIMQIAKDEKSSAKDLGTMISRDPSISSRVLRLANSAFYGYSRAITSIPQAVVVLGFETVKSLALSASVFDVLGRGDSRFFDREKFWLHSIGCAKACELLAKQVRFPDPDSAFVAGLLHDIGKVVLDRFFSEEYQQVMSRIQESPRPIIEVEKEILLGVGHDSVGFWLGQQWKFPTVLLDPIHHHHDPENSEPQGILMASIAHVGDSITRKVGIGSGGRFAGTKHLSR